MGLFSWLRGKEPRDNFSDDDRQYGAVVREQRRLLKQKQDELRLATDELRAKKEQMKLDLEIKKLEQEIAEYDEEDMPEEIIEGSNPEDAMLMAMISKVLGNNTNPAVHSNASNTSQVQEVAKNLSVGVDFTDEDIKKYVGSVPYINRKMLKKLDDDALKRQILNVVPNASPGSIERIMREIRA